MTASKRNIAFVISTLQTGGAERVTSILANHWAQEEKLEVHIICLGNEEQVFYEIHPQVKLHFLEILRPSKNIIDGLINNLFRILKIRKTLKSLQLNTVISFMFATNISTIIASAFCSWNLIISERNDPRKYSEGRSIWNILRKIFYRFSDHLVVQNPPIKEYFEDYGVHTEIIPNPVLKPIPDKAKTHSGENVVIMAMGSLTEQKGFDTLLKAFAIANNKVPNIFLKIAGNGPLKESLERLAFNEGIDSKVTFLGVIKSPANFFQDSDIFILSSRFEGSPNALIEAMSFGLPCISTNCPSGPADLIVNNKSGLLVEVDNIQEMADAICELSINPNKRELFSKHAIKINETYNIKKISSLWLNLLNIKASPFS